MSNKIIEQLQYLKGITLRLGALHEAQVHQLKMWPLLLPNVTEAESQVDVDTQTVTFVCKGKKGKLPADFKKASEIMTSWVRSILWDETRIVISFNKKEVFDSNSIE